MADLLDTLTLDELRTRTSVKWQAYPADVLEDLLLGTVVAADVPGVVSSVGLSRFRALRMLAASARANRR